MALIGAVANDYAVELQSDFAGLVEQLGIYFAALFFTCMVCHGELARLKPSPRYLTEFYLIIAAGGALGGLLVGLVAPVNWSKHFSITSVEGMSPSAIRKR